MKIKERFAKTSKSELARDGLFQEYMPSSPSRYARQPTK